MFDKVLDSIDIFAAPIWGFNFESRHKIHTYLGVWCSFLLFTVISLFGTVKLSHVITRHNPRVSRHAIDG